MSSIAVLIGGVIQVYAFLRWTSNSACAIDKKASYPQLLTLRNQALVPPYHGTSELYLTTHGACNSLLSTHLRWCRRVGWHWSDFWCVTKSFMQL